MTPLDAYSRAVAIAHDHADFDPIDLTRPGLHCDEVKKAVAVVAYLLRCHAGLSRQRVAEALGRTHSTIVPRWLDRLTDEHRARLDHEWANYPAATASHWGPIA